MSQVAHKWTIGSHTVVASLGEGGMAKVYLALNPEPSGRDSLVAVKVLREDVAFDDSELSEMFADEARMAASLDHPNIVRTYEVGLFDGHHFMVMEYLEGQSLYAIQERFAPRGLPLAEELRIIAETAHGLHYAHEKRGADGAALGIIHRDISPQNVFVTYDGQVKLLDFGIAKAASHTHRTRVGIIKGKIDYMSPEQLQSKPLDRRSDIFALGAMLWEAITGKRFGGGQTVPERSKIQARVSGAELRAHVLNPDAPAGLVSIVERAIAIDRDQRYEDAEQFAHDIEHYLASASLEPTARSLAVQLATKFGRERAEIRALIDEQVALAHAGHDRPRSALGARSLASLENDADLVQLRRPSLGFSAGAALQNRAGRTAPGDHEYSFSDAPTAPPSAPPPRPRSAATFSRARVGGAIAVFCVAIAAGRFLAPFDPLPPAAEVTAMTPTTVAASDGPSSGSPVPGTGQAAVRTIKLTIDVKPSNAIVKLDGEPLPALPYKADVRAGEQVHRLEASADGHRVQSLLVTFDRDRTIDIVLQEDGQQEVRGHPEPARTVKGR